jgi:zinc transporter ZupT
MLAASIWSLINPVLEGNDLGKGKSLAIVSIGIIVGTFFLMISDLLYEKNISNNLENKNIKMLNFAIVLHNIPEGMAVRNCYCCIYKF